MSCKHLKDVFKTSSRRLQNVFKMSRRCLKDKYFVLIKTSSKRLEDVFWRRMTKANIFTLIKTSWRCLEDIFWRRRGKTSSSRWMFAGGDVWVIFSHLCFKKTLNASVIYYFYIQHVAKEYCCLGSHWVVFTKTFHAALILASSNLILCAIVRNHSNFRKYWFHAKHSFKRSIETRFK